jgi:serine/threonine protein kinase/Tol biopolymer transport system component
VTEAERRKRIDDMCDAALEREAGDRARFVAAACGEDEAIRQEVEALLSRAQHAEKFLTMPIGAVAAEILSDEGTSLEGRRVGTYEILSLAGKGGMGAVYRARDTRLKRDVALKVLLPEVSHHPERLTRFEREAQLVAALNHPNIAAIFGVEQAGDITALVLEFVEGPTLADRIARGPIRLDEAIPIARQIAEALEAAHEQGIIHCDLKPTNIKVRTDGTVKVLDFGLAKVMEAVSSSFSVSDSAATIFETEHSPSITTMQSGLIMGTVAYMSPEQAKGKPVDRRCDIWSFGVVLFEMLSGQRLYQADTPTEILASVIEREPDLRGLPSSTPLSIRTLIARCLIKDPRNRLQAIGEARIVLERASATPDSSSLSTHGLAVEATSHPWSRVRLVAMLAGASILAGTLAAGALLGWPLAPRQRTAEAPAQVMQLELPAPDGTSLDSSQPVVLSPDGTRITMVAVEPATGKRVLYVRQLNAGRADRLAGTERAQWPFWSPDSRSIGFFADDALKTVSLDGNVQVVCRAFVGSAGVWTSRGEIVYALTGGPLYRVQASGGAPVVVAPIDTRSAQSTTPIAELHGDRILFRVFGTSAGSGLFVAALRDTARWTRIGEPGLNLNGWLVPDSASESGAILVASQNNTAVAYQLDTGTLRLRQPGTLIAANAFPFGFPSQVTFTATPGALAIPQSTQTLAQLTWLDRTGRSLGIVGSPGKYREPAIAPDGVHLAVTGLDVNGFNSIYITSGNGSVLNRVAQGTHPAWSPDGQSLFFAASQRDEGAPSGMYRVPLNNLSNIKQIVDGVAFTPTTSPDDETLIYTHLDPDGHRSIYTARRSAAGDMQLVPYFRSDAFVGLGAFGSRWVAYYSDESGGINEVFVRSFPDPGTRVQVSSGGGRHPRWRRDFKELYYIGPEGDVMAASVKSYDPLAFAEPQTLFRVSGLPQNISWYDVAPDGQRFLFAVPMKGSAGAITIIVNWQELLKKTATQPSRAR